MAPMKQAQLVEPTVIQTSVPFPAVDLEASKEAGNVVLGKHETDTIVVESASELVTVSIQTSLFRTRKGDNSALDIVHDANGRPMIFSVGSDGHLFCIFHVEKAKQSWQLLDITPPASAGAVEVTAFDVLEIKEHLYFSASVRHTPKESDEVHQVFWASLKQPNAQISDDGKVVGFAAVDLNWQPIKNNLGSRAITKLMNAVNPNASGTAAPAFTIFAATRTTGDYYASTYAIDPSPSAPAPWTSIFFGAESHSIVDMQPIIEGGVNKDAKKRAGLVLLHDAPGQTADVVRRCHVLSLNDARNGAFGLRPLNTNKVGTPSAIWTSFNSWGSHDVLVAGNGIAFHQFQDLNDPCLDGTGNIILPHVAFRQVTCKETMLANPRRYILSILGVSEDDELYLIEGERNIANQGIPSFKCSGLPIRTDVAQIACHYNKQLDVMEFIYTTKKDNQIAHLARDPGTGVWVSTNLSAQGPGAVTKEKQYLTTITLSSKSTGNPVPEGYPVSLTSEPMFVKINDLAYRLNRAHPTIVKTNAVGQIDIVTAAPDQFGLPCLDITLDKFAERKPFTFSVDMSSRVMAMMSSIRSKEDLKSLNSPATGKPLFSGVSEQNLDASASLLSHFESLRRRTKEGAPNNHDSDDSASVGSEETLVAWDGTSQGTGKSQETQEAAKPWIKKAIDVAVEFVGDVLEFLKTAVKQTVKFVVKIGAKILRFYLTIQGKVLSFVVKNTAALVRSVVGFLDNVLGTNMMEFFGLHFGKHLSSIQNKLKDVTLGSLTVMERFLTVNRSSLESLFTDAEEVLFGSLEKFREPDTPRQETAAERLVKRILNSPIVKLILKYNPLQWILEGMGEGLSEAFSDSLLPDIKPLAEAVGATVDELLEVFLTAFGQIVDALIQSGTDLLQNPSEMLRIIVTAVKKTFRTVFHATRDAVLVAVDCIIRMVHAIPALLSATWTIPGLTDLWKDWTDQDFSIINFLTYGPAVILDILTLAMPEKQKTAIFATPFKEGWAARIKVEPMYTSFRERADQAALAAMYPGPSRPEDTNPIVMMVLVGSGEGPKDEKHEEDDDNPYGDWMAVIGGIFKLAANTIMVVQANLPAEGIGKKMIAFKTLFAVVALAGMIGDGVSYLSSAGEKPGKDPKDVANLGQNIGMCIGCCVSVAGVGVEALLDMAKESTEMRIEGEINPIARWQQEGYQRQNKVAHSIGGVAFNIGAAALTGFVPGCWTKPRPMHIAQTFASFGAAGAIITANYFDNTPHGKVVKWGMWGTDLTLTVVGLYTGIQGIADRAN